LILNGCTFSTRIKLLINFPKVINSLSLTDSEKNQTEVKLQMMGSSLPTTKPFIELLINDIIAEKQKNPIKVMTVFVSSNLSNAKQLETKLAE